MSPDATRSLAALLFCSSLAVAGCGAASAPLPQSTVAPAASTPLETARLQSAMSDRPVVLLYDTKSGHAGGEPESKWLDDASLQLAFLAWQLGIHVEPVAGRTH